MITDFRLKVFRAVAERLSFTRAADELFVTQPAVTKHINELEKQLGVPLFVRRRNAVALTPQGELLLGYVRRLLALYAELNDAFAGDGETFGGELAVGASTTISQYVLPAILSRFKKRYPEVRLTLCNGNTELIERMVADEKLDFGVIEGNAGNPQLHYETFMEDELVLVTASSNRSLRQEEIAAADLKKLPLVIRETGSGTLDVVERGARFARNFVADAAGRDAVGQHREHQALPLRVGCRRLRFGAGRVRGIAAQPAAGDRDRRPVGGAPFQFRDAARPQ